MNSKLRNKTCVSQQQTSILVRSVLPLCYLWACGGGGLWRAVWSTQGGEVAESQQETDAYQTQGTHCTEILSVDNTQKQTLYYNKTLDDAYIEIQY